MLPTEVFAEAVAFFRIFGLNALAVTSAMCSKLAIKASAGIRWEEFLCLRFYITNRAIHILRQTDKGVRRARMSLTLTFPSEHDTIEFVAAAFPKCIFEGVTISYHLRKRLLDAIGRVADSVVVKGSLQLPDDVSPDDTLRLGREFRKVKVSFLQRILARSLMCFEGISTRYTSLDTSAQRQSDWQGATQRIGRFLSMKSKGQVKEK